MSLSRGLSSPGLDSLRSSLRSSQSFRSSLHRSHTWSLSSPTPNEAPISSLPFPQERVSSQGRGRETSEEVPRLRSPSMSTWSSVSSLLGYEDDDQIRSLKQEITTLTAQCERFKTQYHSERLRADDLYLDLQERKIEVSALDDEVRRLSLDLDFKDAECNALADEVEQRNLMLNEASNLILQMASDRDSMHGDVKFFSEMIEKRNAEVISLITICTEMCKQLTSISEVEEEQRYREEELERIIASYEADRSAVQNALDRVDRNESELSDGYSSSERSLPTSPASHPLLRTRSDSNLSRTSTRQSIEDFTNRVQSLNQSLTAEDIRSEIQSTLEKTVAPDLVRKSVDSMESLSLDLKHEISSLRDELKNTKFDLDDTNPLIRSLKQKLRSKSERLERVQRAISNLSQLELSGTPFVSSTPEDRFLSTVESPKSLQRVEDVSSLRGTPDEIRSVGHFAEQKLDLSSSQVDSPEIESNSSMITPSRMQNEILMELATVKKERNDALRVSEKTTRELMTLREEFNRMRAEYTSLQDELDDCKAQLAESEELMRLASEELERRNEDQRNLQDHISELEKALQALRVEYVDIARESSHVTRNSTDRSLKTVQQKSSSSVNSVGTSEQPTPIDVISSIVFLIQCLSSDLHVEHLLRIQDFSSIGSLLEAVIQHRTLDPRANTLLELSRTRSVQDSFSGLLSSLRGLCIVSTDSQHGDLAPVERTSRYLSPAKNFEVSGKPHSSRTMLVLGHPVSQSTIEKFAHDISVGYDTPSPLRDSSSSSASRGSDASPTLRVDGVSLSESNEAMILEKSERLQRSQSTKAPVLLNQRTESGGRSRSFPNFSLTSKFSHQGERASSHVEKPAIDGLLSEFEEDMNQVESVLYDERTKEDIDEEVVQSAIQVAQTSYCDLLRQMSSSLQIKKDRNQHGDSLRDMIQNRRNLLSTIRSIHSARDVARSRLQSLFQVSDAELADGILAGDTSENRVDSIPELENKLDHLLSESAPSISPVLIVTSSDGKVEREYPTNHQGSISSGVQRVASNRIKSVSTTSEPTVPFASLSSVHGENDSLSTTSRSSVASSVSSGILSSDHSVQENVPVANAMVQPLSQSKQFVNRGVQLSPDRKHAEAKNPSSRKFRAVRHVSPTIATQIPHLSNSRELLKKFSRENSSLRRKIRSLQRDLDQKQSFSVQPDISSDVTKILDMRRKFDFTLLMKLHKRVVHLRKLAKRSSHLVPDINSDLISSLQEPNEWTNFKLFESVLSEDAQITLVPVLLRFYFTSLRTIHLILERSMFHMTTENSELKSVIRSLSGHLTVARESLRRLNPHSRQIPPLSLPTQMEEKIIRLLRLPETSERSERPPFTQRTLRMVNKYGIPNRDFEEFSFDANSAIRDVSVTSIERLEDFERTLLVNILRDVAEFLDVKDVCDIIPSLTSMFNMIRKSEIHDENFERLCSLLTIPKRSSWEDVLVECERRVSFSKPSVPPSSFPVDSTNIQCSNDLNSDLFEFSYSFLRDYCDARDILLPLFVDAHDWKNASSMFPQWKESLREDLDDIKVTYGNLQALCHLFGGSELVSLESRASFSSLMVYVKHRLSDFQNEILDLRSFLSETLHKYEACQLELENARDRIPPRPDTRNASISPIPDLESSFSDSIASEAASAASQTASAFFAERETYLTELEYSTSRYKQVLEQLCTELRIPKYSHIIPAVQSLQDRLVILERHIPSLEKLSNDLQQTLGVRRIDDILPSVVELARRE